MTNHQQPTANTYRPASKSQPQTNAQLNQRQTTINNNQHTDQSIQEKRRTILRTNQPTITDLPHKLITN